MRISNLTVPQRCILALVLLCAALNLPGTIAAQQTPSHNGQAGVATTDPNKPSSERNHHIAGLFLIAIGLCSILSKQEKSLGWLQRLPPVLFIAAGLFLAAWSDDEIWPRGHLSWTWLLRHDAEARQHKLYALLLITLGLIEYARTSAPLRRRWLAVASTLLCVLGGTALFFHQHSAMAAVPAHVTAVSAAEPNPANAQSSQMMHEHGAQHQHNMASSNPRVDGPGQSPPPHIHNHAEANVQRQHIWFAIVGFCVAAFKFLHDTGRPPVRLRDHLWGSSVIVLGILLLLYTE